MNDKYTNQHILPRWYLNKILNKDVQYVGYQIKDGKVFSKQKIKKPISSKSKIFIDLSSPYGKFEQCVGPSTSKMDSEIATKFNLLFNNEKINDKSDKLLDKAYQLSILMIGYYNLARNPGKLEKFLELIKQDIAIKSIMNGYVRPDVSFNQAYSALEQGVLGTEIISSYIGMLDSLDSIKKGDKFIDSYIDVPINDKAVGITDKPNATIDLHDIFPKIFTRPCKLFFIRYWTNKLFILIQTPIFNGEDKKEVMDLTKKKICDSIPQIVDLYMDLITKSANYYIIWPLDSKIKLIENEIQNNQHFEYCQNKKA